MPLIATRGAASAQGFGEFAQSAAPVYIEDVFSTYLYTGNGSSQTITNGLDLSGKGGLVWLKARSTATANTLWGTGQTSGYYLGSSFTSASQDAGGEGVTSLTSSGFTVAGSNNNYGNGNGTTYASWTFCKQPKFFDVVTWTGDSTNNRQISHNLGVTPGCIIIKITNGNNSWIVWHRSLPTYGGELNSTNEFLSAYYTNLLNGAPTSTTFTVSYNGYNTTNETGYTYVAYLFAHDAGGFGDAGDQNVISCGSYTGNGSATGPTITLGWEPQWVMIKNTTTADSGTGWRIFDNMRGIITGGTDGVLFANSSNAEVYADVLSLNATGFQLTAPGSGINNSGDTYIYIAIRRGPMETPTSGTQVYAAAYGLSTSPVFVSGFPVDVFMEKNPAAVENWYQGSRLTGTQYVSSNATAAQATGSAVRFDYMNGAIAAFSGSTNYVGWTFRRAPSFLDVVCWTGNSTSGRTISHNLGVVPELIIVKRRDSVADWPVYNTTVTNAKALFLNQSAAQDFTDYWADTTPTASVFTVGLDYEVNQNNGTYFAWLFATCPGVSKVGSYTGTGTTQQINCGFTTGARFVLVKRISSTGEWYLWDSTRGIVSGSDPFLLLNVSNGEVTGTDYIDTYSAGFEISSTAPAEINANGSTFIFLAIA